MVIAVASCALVVDLDAAHRALRARLGRARARARPRRRGVGRPAHRLGRPAASPTPPIAAEFGGRWSPTPPAPSTTTAPRPPTAATPSACSPAGPCADGACDATTATARPTEPPTSCTVNGAEHQVPERRGSARACCTCCASASACPAPRTPASRASAARARCWSTACWCAPAWSWRRRRRLRRSPRSRASPRDRRRCSATCSRPSSTPAPCSAGSARPGLCGRPRPPRPRHPTRPTSRSARPSPATCAAAPATAASSTPSSSGRRADAAATDGRPIRRPDDRRAPAVRARIGDSPRRPDGDPEGPGRVRLLLRPRTPTACCGAAPCARPTRHARIRSIDVGPALAMPACRAVLTADDVPGAATYGLDHRRPAGVRRRRRPLRGRADRRGRRRPPRDGPPGRSRPSSSTTSVLDAPGRPRGRRRRRQPIHPDGNVVRHLVIRHGDPAADGRRGRRGHLRGRHAGPGVPRARVGPGRARPSDGGVDLYVPTQFLHVDRDQVAACLGLPRGAGAPPPRRRRRGVRGAGGRQPPGPRCLLALRTGRPVKMVLPARRVLPRPRPPPPGPHAGTATTPTATARSSRSRPGRCSTAAPTRRRRRRSSANAARFAAGPVPRAQRRTSTAGRCAPTTRPCGAMRGFGAVQACFAHESQMDKLAAALGMDPRRAAAAQRAADRRPLPTGQVITRHGPGRRVHPGARWPTRCPPALAATRCWPGPAAPAAPPTATTIRRGVGFAVGFKNLMFSEGFDDYSTSRGRPPGRRGRHRHVRGAEVGPGLRDPRPADRPRRSSASTTWCSTPPRPPTIGSAGSTSACRQTWMSGGAVAQASRRSVASAGCQARRPPGRASTPTTLTRRRHDRSVDGDRRRIPWPRPCPTQPIETPPRSTTHRPSRSTRTARATPTCRFAFAAHRAVVDVDPDLGLVRVVQITPARTSDGCCTPCSSSARSRAASPRASGWR